MKKKSDCEGVDLIRYRGKKKPNPRLTFSFLILRLLEHAWLVTMFHRRIYP